MTLARTALTLAAVFALGACDRATEAPASVPEAEPQAAPAGQQAPDAAAAVLALDSEGLRAFTAGGSSRALSFGMPQDAVLTAVSALLETGTPEVTTNPECGEGPMQFADYPNGLQLAFQDGRFAGWFLDEAGLTTVDGVGVGSDRAGLEAARVVERVPDSTLGVEFSSGGLGGFLSSEGPDARVESLHAGLTCFFR